jgi:hypothetical protein
MLRRAQDLARRLTRAARTAWRAVARVHVRDSVLELAGGAPGERGTIAAAPASASEPDWGFPGHAIREGALIPEVHAVALRREPGIGVRARDTALPPPAVRAATVAQQPGAVGSCGCALGAEVHGAACDLGVALLRVASDRSLIAAIPCERRAAQATPAVHEAWLRQAARAGHVAPGQAEVVAVFRDVPIEVVESLEYVPATRTLRYAFGASARRRTRLHAVAAVRDLRSHRIQVIADPTDYRMVNLA